MTARSVQSVTVPSSRVSRECRSLGLRSPPFQSARDCPAFTRPFSLVAGHPSRGSFLPFSPLRKSGKEKAHKHKEMFPGDCPGGGGSPDRVGRGLPTGGQGSKIYVLCAEPKEHKQFRPGTRPGGVGYPAGRIGDRGDREIVYVPNVYVLFRPLEKCSVL